MMVLTPGSVNCRFGTGAGTAGQRSQIRSRRHYFKRADCARGGTAQIKPPATNLVGILANEYRRALARSGHFRRTCTLPKDVGTDAPPYGSISLLSFRQG